LALMGLLQRRHVIDLARKNPPRVFDWSVTSVHAKQSGYKFQKCDHECCCWHLYLAGRRGRQLAVPDGSFPDLVGTWWLEDDRFQYQYWQITPVGDGVKDKYYIVNIGNGLYLALKDGSPEDATKVQCLNMDTLFLTKIQWYITAAKNGHWKLQNVAASQDDSKAGYLYKLSANVRGEHDDGTDNLLWDLHRKTRDAAEIKAITKGNANLKDAKNLCPNYYYLQIPHSVAKTIATEAKLADLLIVPGRFDVDAKAIAFKHAVNVWARETLKAEGFYILVGVLAGKVRGGTFAINWYLNDTLDGIAYYPDDADIKSGLVNQFAFF